MHDDVLIFIPFLGLISVPVNLKIGNYVSSYALAMEAQVLD